MEHGQETYHNVCVSYLSFANNRHLLTLNDAHNSVITVTVVSFKLSYVVIQALLEVDSERGTSFPTGQ